MTKMRATLVLYVFCSLMTGCAAMGLENPFGHDPLTGGADRSASALLNIPIPRGLQFYVDHSTNRQASDNNEGLETYRGNAAPSYVTMQFYENLKAAGWKLETFVRKGDRSVSIYNKGQEYATLVIRRQGMMTLAELWASLAVPEGSAPSFIEPTIEDYTAIPGEVYEPERNDGAKAPDKGNVETWGAGIEEKEL